jgi:RNA polymerase-binding transcription factor
MHTNPAIASRKKALQRKLKKLLEPSAEREIINVETFADPVDQLSSAATRDLAIHLVDRNSQLALEVLSALTRIKEGAYGFCESCDEPIAAKRLDALPWARLCLSCQSRQETGQVHSAGHVVEAA